MTKFPWLYSFCIFDQRIGSAYLRGNKRTLIRGRVCNLLYYRRNTVYSSPEHSPKALRVTYRDPWVMSTHAYLYSLVTPSNTKQNIPILLHSVFGRVVKFVAFWFFSKLKFLHLNPSKDIKIFKAGKYKVHETQRSGSAVSVSYIKNRVIKISPHCISI